MKGITMSDDDKKFDAMKEVVAAAFEAGAKVTAESTEIGSVRNQPGWMSELNSADDLDELRDKPGYILNGVKVELSLK